MKILRVFLVCLFFIWNLNSEAQNVVSNGSFEEYTSCPYVNGADPGGVVAWSIPPEGWTPDYYHPCAGLQSFLTPWNGIGFQQPSAGVAYMGFFAFSCSAGTWPPGGEAYMNQLSQPLLAGKTYVFKAYVSLADSVDYAVSGLGFLVSELPMTSQSPWYSLEPTYADTSRFFESKTDWELICDTFVAFGGEQYLTIGNFQVDELIDTLFVGGGWANEFNACNAYYYLDDVSIVELDSSLSIASVEAVGFEAYPNPASSQVQLNFTGIQKPNIIRTYSIDGRKLETLSWQSEIDVSEYPEGIYILKVQFENGAFGVERLIINR